MATPSLLSTYHKWSHILKVSEVYGPQCGFCITRGTPEISALQCHPVLFSHSQLCRHLGLTDLPSPFQTDTLYFFLFSKLNDTDWTSGFRNIINISITPLLWSFGQLQKNRKSFESLHFNCHISQTCFPSTACVIFPPFALVSAICSSRWCQCCDWERRNCGRESFHHYKRYRSEDGWCGRRNVWTLLWGAQHHVPGAQWPAHCRHQPYWRIAKSGELNHINQP